MLDIDLDRFEGDVRKSVEAALSIVNNINNLSTFWVRDALPIIQAEVEALWDNQGYGTWKPHQDPTDHDLMYDTGALKASWTKRGATGNVHRFGKREMDWGSRLYGGGYEKDRPVAGYLAKTQRGARRSLRRKLEEALLKMLLKDAGVN